MSSDRHIFEGTYSHGRPYVKAKVVVIDPNTGRQTTIEKNFWVDTGFDGGIHIAQSHMQDIVLIGISPVAGSIGVAGGKTSPAYRCLAYLQQIGGHEFPMPGIETELVLHGSDPHGLLGLEILKHWIAEFDGKREFLTISRHRLS